jgi:hypothetical protein
MKKQVGVLPAWVIRLFFWMGLTAAVCVRLLAFISRYDEVAALWIWRFAMVCYTFFFGYRYWIGSRRRKTIQDYDLIASVEQAENMDQEHKDAALYILRSIMRSKELFNYAFIFCLSLLALLLDALLG